mgnify:CR=1 FL=1
MGYGSILSRSRKASSFYPTIRIVGVTGDKIPTIQKGKAVAISEAVGSNYIAKPWAFGEYEVKVDGVTIAKVNVTQLIEYSVAAPSSTLNNNSWEVIRLIADQGVGANYWNVGDRKAVILNGTVGTLTLSNYTTYCFILGFNHNAELEGSNTIHFQFGKTALSGGMDVCLCDSSYDSHVSTTGHFSMNNSQTNAGGWSNSQMRTNICGTNLSSYSGTIIAVIPAELRATLKAVAKYTDNTGGGSSAASNVTATEDYFFLLSEFEVFGSISHANSNEKSEQAQYAYYSVGNSKIKYKHNNTSVAARWWLRSPTTNFPYLFANVFTDGHSTNGYADISFGFAPGFCV